MDAIFVDVELSSGHTPPPAANRRWDGQDVQHLTGGNGRSAAMADRIFPNKPRGTMTSATWHAITVR